MGKGIAPPFYEYFENTVCDGCFHKDVCGDKDYLHENACANRAPNITTMQKELAEFKQKQADGLLVELPTHIGGEVFISGEYKEIDGTMIKFTEESALAGFINEDGRFFYLCYTKEHGSCDIEPQHLHLDKQSALDAIEENKND